jgi:N-acyl-D-aspartate/D-glutamate deacylase
MLNAILLGLLLGSWGFGQDLVLVNGSVVDGTGKPRVAANVRIRNGRITDIGLFKPAAGEMLLDVKGMIVAPGFIDLQNLSPSGIEKDSGGLSLVTQGVTTALLGSDGSGPYSVEDFMLPFDEKPPMLNIAVLVGHGTVRRQIMGPDYKREATADEIERMTELVSGAMKQGAFGLGSDLRREPESFSSPPEFAALAGTVARFGGVVVMNLRDETEKALGAVREAINVARDTKASTQVLSTNKAINSEIDKARAQRVDIATDSYSFAQYTREKGVAVERAIQRLSAAPASRVGLRERGILRKGVQADIVVFNPQATSAGMKYVFVNGVMAIKDGQPTDARSGHALR